MKSERQWLIVSMVSLVLAATRVQATGPPDQGTLMEGQGVDWQRSATELQALAVMSAKAFPPIGEKFSTNAADFVVSTCKKISPLAERCEVTATVRKPHLETQLCGHWLKDTPPPIQPLEAFQPFQPIQPLFMYVLLGKPDGSGAFTFGGGGSEKTTDVTFACSVTKPAAPDPWEWSQLGAVGKCILWPNGQGFAPQPADHGNEFNACIRAVRADYCGNGITHTVDGTHIDLYRVPLPPHTSYPLFLLEAWWNEKGAICVIHARWLTMSPHCQNEVFTQVLGSTYPAQGPGGSWSGIEYHCDPAKLKMPDTGNCGVNRDLIQRAMKNARLADDSKIQ